MKDAKRRVIGEVPLEVELREDDKGKVVGVPFRIVRSGPTVNVETPAMQKQRRRVERMRRGILIASYVALGFALAALTVGIIGLATDAKPRWGNVYAIVCGVVFALFNALRIRRLQREARRP